MDSAIQLRLSGLTKGRNGVFPGDLSNHVEQQRVSFQALHIAASQKKSSDFPTDQKRDATLKRSAQPSQKQQQSRPTPPKQTAPSALTAVDLENAKQLRLFGVEVPYEEDAGKNSVDVTNVLIERVASMLNIMVRTSCTSLLIL